MCAGPIHLLLVRVATLIWLQRLQRQNCTKAALMSCPILFKIHFSILYFLTWGLQSGWPLRVGGPTVVSWRGWQGGAHAVGRPPVHVSRGPPGYPGGLLAGGQGTPVAWGVLAAHLAPHHGVQHWFCDGGPGVLVVGLGALALDCLAGVGGLLGGRQ